jgi:hypothetical protein
LDSLFFILFFVFAATKQSGHSHLQISTAEAIRIVCDSAAAVSPQTPPTNKRLRAQVGPFYQSSELFSGSTRITHSKIGGFDDVPIGFLTIAKKLIWKYQRVLTKKASVKALLCDRRYSAGKLPPKLKPRIIRQDITNTPTIGLLSQTTLYFESLAG